MMQVYPCLDHQLQSRFLHAVADNDYLVLVYFLAVSTILE